MDCKRSWRNGYISISLLTYIHQHILYLKGRLPVTIGSLLYYLQVMKSLSKTFVIISLSLFLVVYLFTQYANRKYWKEVNMTRHAEIKGFLDEIHDSKGIVTLIRLANMHEYKIAISAFDLSGHYAIRDAVVGDSVYKAADSDTVVLFKSGRPGEVYKFLMLKH
jgi:hypothetical protein